MDCDNNVKFADVWARAGGGGGAIFGGPCACACACGPGNFTSTHKSY